MPVMVCKCGARLEVESIPTDPVGTHEIHGIPCPDCDDGDFYEPEYRSIDGTSIYEEF